MIAGDKALGWALGNPDVAVFWNAGQPEPGEQVNLYGKQIVPDRVYHVSPAGVLGFDVAVAAAKSSASDLARTIRYIEEPTDYEDSEFFPRKWGGLLRGDSYQEQRRYRPTGLAYSHLLGSTTIESTTKVTAVLNQEVSSSESSFFVERDERLEGLTLKVLNLTLNRFILVYPDPVIARYYARNTGNDSRVFDKPVYRAERDVHVMTNDASVAVGSLGLAVAKPW